MLKEGITSGENAVKMRRKIAVMCSIIMLSGLLTACEKPLESISTNGTAYSRTMSGDIKNWNDNGCSYSIDEEGGVTLSYDGGESTVIVPLTLSLNNGSGKTPNIGNSGFYISEEKTAIAYARKGNSDAVTVISSDDMGQTWKNASIDFDAPVTWMSIGFTTKDDGWLIICSFAGMGAENHHIYKTTNGGKSWAKKESSIDEIYGRMLSGAGFINDNTGFMCFRYENLDFQPAVCVTKDGGLTWSKLNIEMPEEYNFNKTAYSPIYDGEIVIMPIMLSDNDGNVGTIYLTSGDNGETWSCGAYTDLGDYSGGPYVGYVKSSEEKVQIYTEKGGTFMMSIPIEAFDGFPATDRLQDGWVTIPFFCGSNNGLKWAVPRSGPSAGLATTNIFLSTNGGESFYRVGDADSVYAHSISGAGFYSPEVGFLCYYLYEGPQPEIFRTIDGGNTWKRVIVDVPERLKNYSHLTPLSPSFSGESGRMPVINNSKEPPVAYLITSDGGLTWEWEN